MRRTLAYGWVGALLVGCSATGPIQDNPLVVRPAAKADCTDNPVYVPFNSAPASYKDLFEKVHDVLSDSGFEIAYSDRYDGRIETFPKIAPGLEQPWKPGSPDFHQRLVASFQTIRHRAIVIISPANGSGYFVDVKVFKELEDLARPSQATAGAASFRSEPTLERQYEVVEINQFQKGWIPVGRDFEIEQVILDRLAHFDSPCVQPAPCVPPAPCVGGAGK